MKADDPVGQWEAAPQPRTIHKGRLLVVLVILAALAPFLPRVYRSGLVVNYEHAITERIFGATLSDEAFDPYRVSGIVVGGFHMFRRDDSLIHLGLYGAQKPESARVVRAILIEPKRAELVVDSSQYTPFESPGVGELSLLGGIENAGWLGPDFSSELAGTIPGFTVEVTVEIDGSVATLRYRFNNRNYWVPPFPT